MKSIVISLISLVIIVLIWAGFYYYSVEENYIYFSEHLEELSSFVELENWDDVEINMDQNVKKWEKTRNLWIYILNQHHVNEIDITMYKLKKYLKEKNIPLSLGTIEELKMNFKIVKESECLTLENIF